MKQISSKFGIAQPMLREKIFYYLTYLFASLFPI